MSDVQCNRCDKSAKFLLEFPCTTELQYQFEAHLLGKSTKLIPFCTSHTKRARGFLQIIKLTKEETL